jgi:hypothetical protein
MLSVWDRLFGTLMVPEPNEDFTFGLSNEEHREYRSALRLWVVPLVKIYAMAARAARLPAGWRRRAHDHV